jgi:uncharacterized membrane-anchored protein
MRLHILAAVLVLGVAQPALSAAPTPPSAESHVGAEQAAELAKAQALLKSLKPQTGVIALPEAKVHVDVSDRYLFLDNKDARTLLVDLWGNSPDGMSNVLGMLIPKDIDPLDERFWGAVITVENDGYVSDKDAKTVNYTELLTEMQKATTERNEERRKAGYPTIDLVGWAQPPRYDPAHHTLVWARHLRGTNNEVVNYDVRVLGRKGVLSMNIVASMDQLSAVTAAAEDVRQTASFDTGQRYADYKDGDKRAAYGIAGLIAAGVGVAAVKKAGLLAVLFIALKKFGIFIFAGLAGGFAKLRNKLGLGPKKTPPVEPTRSLADFDPETPPGDDAGKP